MEQKKIEEIGKQYQEIKGKYLCELAWNDPEKKDELIIVSRKPFKEVMQANAKGTTLYEMIDIYGGAEGVAKVFPGDKSMYGDFTGTPETFGPEELELMALRMTEYANSLKQKEDKKGENKEPKEPEKGSVTEVTPNE